MRAARSTILAAIAVAASAGNPLVTDIFPREAQSARPRRIALGGIEETDKIRVSISGAPCAWTGSTQEDGAGTTTAPDALSLLAPAVSVSGFMWCATDGSEGGGLHDVQVLVDEGAGYTPAPASKDAFLVDPAGSLYQLEVVPTVSSVSPQIGSVAGGTILTLRGSGLAAVGANNAVIRVGTAGCTVLTSTNSEIVCVTTPAVPTTAFGALTSVIVTGINAGPAAAGTSDAARRLRYAESLMAGALPKPDKRGGRKLGVRAEAITGSAPAFFDTIWKPNANPNFFASSRGVLHHVLVDPAAVASVAGTATGAGASALVASATQGQLSAPLFSGMDAAVAANLASSWTTVLSTMEATGALPGMPAGAAAAASATGRVLATMFTAATDGVYKFTIASSTPSRLLVTTTPQDHTRSTDPALGVELDSLTVVASCNVGVSPGTYTTYTSQTSQGIALTAGSVYYIEAQQWFTPGVPTADDHLSVGMFMSSQLYSSAQTAMARDEIQQLTLAVATNKRVDSVSIAAGVSSGQFALGLSLPATDTAMGSARFTRLLDATASGTAMGTAVEEVAGTVECAYSIPDYATFTTYDTHGFETASNSWLGRGGSVPENLAGRGYCGRYGLYVPNALAINFDERYGFSPDQAVGGYYPAEFPYICMAYRIPEGTQASLLLHLNDAAWASVGLTEEAPAGGAGGAVRIGSFDITADGEWHHTCAFISGMLTDPANADALAAALAAGGSSFPIKVTGVVMGPASDASLAAGTYGGPLFIDEFAISNQGFTVHRFLRRSPSAAPLLDMKTFTRTFPPSPGNPDDIYAVIVADASVLPEDEAARWLGEMDTAAVGAIAVVEVPAQADDLQGGLNGGAALPTLFDVTWTLQDCGVDSPWALTATDVSLETDEMVVAGGLAAFGIAPGGVVDGNVNGKVGGQPFVTITPEQTASTPLGGQLSLALGAGQWITVSPSAPAPALQAAFARIGVSASVTASGGCSSKRYIITFTGAAAASADLILDAATLTGDRPVATLTSLSKAGIVFPVLRGSSLRVPASGLTPLADVLVGGAGSVCAPAAGDSVNSCVFAATGTATPVLYGVSPQFGRPGDSITITGQRLRANAPPDGALPTDGSPVIAVTFGSLACAVESWLDTAVVCTLQEPGTAVASVAHRGWDVRVPGLGRALVVNEEACLFTVMPSVAVLLDEEAGTTAEEVSMPLVADTVVTLATFGVPADVDKLDVFIDFATGDGTPETANAARAALGPDADHTPVTVLSITATTITVLVPAMPASLAPYGDAMTTGLAFVAALKIKTTQRGVLSALGVETSDATFADMATYLAAPVVLTTRVKYTIPTQDAPRSPRLMSVNPSRGSIAGGDAIAIAIDGMDYNEATAAAFRVFLGAGVCRNVAVRAAETASTIIVTCNVPAPTGLGTAARVDVATGAITVPVLVKLPSGAVISAQNARYSFASTVDAVEVVDLTFLAAADPDDPADVVPIKAAFRKLLHAMDIQVAVATRPVAPRVLGTRVQRSDLYAALPEDMRIAALARSILRHPLLAYSYGANAAAAAARRAADARVGAGGGALLRVTGTGIAAAARNLKLKLTTAQYPAGVDCAVLHVAEDGNSALALIPGALPPTRTPDQAAAALFGASTSLPVPVGWWPHDATGVLGAGTGAGAAPVGSPLALTVPNYGSSGAAANAALRVATSGVAFAPGAKASFLDTAVVYPAGVAATVPAARGWNAASFTAHATFAVGPAPAGGVPTAASLVRVLAATDGAHGWGLMVAPGVCNAVVVAIRSAATLPPGVHFPSVCTDLAAFTAEAAAAGFTVVTATLPTGMAAVTGVYDAAALSLSLYIDGALASTLANKQYVPNIGAATPVPLSIGAAIDAPEAAAALPAIIVDDVAIFGAALDASGVNALAAVTRGVAPVPSASITLRNGAAVVATVPASVSDAWTPIITGVTPRAIAPGATITITGMRFAIPDRGDMDVLALAPTVQVGDVDCGVEAWNDTAIICSVATPSVGEAAVSVLSPARGIAVFNPLLALSPEQQLALARPAVDGEEPAIAAARAVLASAASLGVPRSAPLPTVTAPVALYSIEPAIGSLAGGTRLSIAGSWPRGIGAATVRLVGADLDVACAVDAAASSATAIVCTTPALPDDRMYQCIAHGRCPAMVAAHVILAGASQAAAMGGVFTFLAASTPQIQMLSVRWDVVAGETATYAGNGFGEDPAAVQVRFGGVLAVVTAVQETSVTVTVPRGPFDRQAVTVFVAGRGAGITLDENLNVVTPPTVIYTSGVQGVAPPQGGYGGATLLTLQGRGFSLTDKDVVLVGDQECLPAPPQPEDATIIAAGGLPPFRCYTPSLRAQDAAASVDRDLNAMPIVSFPVVHATRLPNGALLRRPLEGADVPVFTYHLFQTPVISTVWQTESPEGVLVHIAGSDLGNEDHPLNLPANLPMGYEVPITLVSVGATKCRTINLFGGNITALCPFEGSVAGSFRVAVDKPMAVDMGGLVTETIRAWNGGIIFTATFTGSVNPVPFASLGSLVGPRPITITGAGLPTRQAAAAKTTVEICGVPCTPLPPADDATSAAMTCQPAPLVRPSTLLMRSSRIAATGTVAVGEATGTTVFTFPGVMLPPAAHVTSARLRIVSKAAVAASALTGVRINAAVITSRAGTPSTAESAFDAADAAAGAAVFTANIGELVNGAVSTTLSSPSAMLVVQAVGYDFSVTTTQLAGAPLGDLLCMGAAGDDACAAAGAAPVLEIVYELAPGAAAGLATELLSGWASTDASGVLTCPVTVSFTPVDPTLPSTATTTPVVLRSTDAPAVAPPTTGGEAGGDAGAPPTRPAVLRALQAVAARSPVVTSVEPALGSIDGGFTVTLRGSDLDGADAVMLAGVACNVTSATSTMVTCVANAKGSPDAQPQPVLVDIASYGTAVLATPDVAFQYAYVWSAGSTWQPPAQAGAPAGAADAAEVPSAGDTVVITSGVTIVLDVSTPRVHTLLVRGRLVATSAASLSVLASNIIVDGGEFVVGSDGIPFSGEAIIELAPNADETVNTAGVVVSAPSRYQSASGVLLVTNGGALSLVGSNTRTFARVTTTASHGATSLVVDGPLPGWVAGAKLLVTTTGTTGSLTETVTIASISVDGTTVNLAAPLAYEHEMAHFDYGARTVPVAAEVIFLGRSVRVTGGTASATDKNGAIVHTLVGAGAAEPSVALRNVEFRNVGKAEAGMAALSFATSAPAGATCGRCQVTSSVVVRSYHDGIVVHGVSGVVVADSAVVDVRGSGITVRVGIEQGIALTNTIVTGVQPALFPITAADSTPSGFSIAAPATAINGCVATDNSHHGFSLITSAFDGAGNPVCAQTTRLGAFADNVARSNGRHGLRIGDYNPRAVACDASSAPVSVQFSGFAALRNGGSGVQWSSGSRLVFTGLALADNGESNIEFPSAPFGEVVGPQSSTRLQDSVLVARTLPWVAAGSVLNTAGRTIIAASTRPVFGLVAPADHGLFVDGVLFVGYNNVTGYAVRGCAKCEVFAPSDGGYETRFARIGWEDSVNRWAFTREHEAAFLDLDGTLTAGATESLQVPVTVLPANELTDAAGCLNQNMGGALASALCTSTTRWRRLSIAEPAPSSLLSYALTVNIGWAASTVAPPRAVVNRHVGWAALVPVGHAMGMKWDAVDHTMPSEVYPTTFSWSFGWAQPEDQILLRYTFGLYAQLPDYMILSSAADGDVNVTLAAEPSLPAVAMPFGAWHFNRGTRTVTWLASGDASSVVAAGSAANPAHAIAATWQSYRCPNGICPTRPNCQPGSFAFTESFLRTSERAGSVSLRIARSNGLCGVVHVAVSTFALADRPIDDTSLIGLDDFTPALPGVNYVDTTVTATFEEGDSFQTITVPVLDNGAYDYPYKRFGVRIMSADAGASVYGTLSTTVVQLLDDSEPASYSVMNAAQLSASAAATPNCHSAADLSSNGGLVVQFVRTGSLAREATIAVGLQAPQTVAVSLMTSHNGTAVVQGVDIPAGIAIARFAVGADTATVTLPVPLPAFDVARYAELRVYRSVNVRWVRSDDSTPVLPVCFVQTETVPDGVNIGTPSPAPVIAGSVAAAVIALGLAAGGLVYVRSRKAADAAKLKGKPMKVAAGEDGVVSLVSPMHNTAAFKAVANPLMPRVQPDDGSLRKYSTILHARSQQPLASVPSSRNISRTRSTAQPMAERPITPSASSVHSSEVPGSVHMPVTGAPKVSAAWGQDPTNVPGGDFARNNPLADARRGDRNVAEPLPTGRIAPQLRTFRSVRAMSILRGPAAAAELAAAVEAASQASETASVRSGSSTSDPAIRHRIERAGERLHANPLIVAGAASVLPAEEHGVSPATAAMSNRSLAMAALAKDRRTRHNTGAAAHGKRQSSSPTTTPAEAVVSNPVQRVVERDEAATGIAEESVLPGATAAAAAPVAAVRPARGVGAATNPLPTSSSSTAVDRGFASYASRSTLIAPRAPSSASMLRSPSSAAMHAPPVLNPRVLARAPSSAGVVDRDGAASPTAAATTGRTSPTAASGPATAAASSMTTAMPGQPRRSPSAAAMGGYAAASLRHAPSFAMTAPGVSRQAHPAQPEGGAAAAAPRGMVAPPLAVPARDPSGAQQVRRAR